MLEKGADVHAKAVNRIGEFEEGVAPLHVAAEHGHLAVVEALVKKGADVHAKD